MYTSLGLVIRFYYVVGNGSNILEKRPDVVKTQASNHLQFQEQFRNVTLLTTKKNPFHITRNSSFSIINGALRHIFSQSIQSLFFLECEINLILIALTFEVDEWIVNIEYDQFPFSDRVVKYYFVRHSVLRMFGLPGKLICICDIVIMYHQWNSRK